MSTTKKRIRDALAEAKMKNPNFTWREECVFNNFWGTAFIFTKRSAAEKIAKETGLIFTKHYKEWAITIY